MDGRNGRLSVLLPICDKKNGRFPSFIPSSVIRRPSSLCWRGRVVGHLWRGCWGVNGRFPLHF
ncbi:MAG: hypothetical protein KDE56_17225 [Anaerolineales bacterium]|nr:hypothetical protein [Anaerolineales bacterium]